VISNTLSTTQAATYSLLIPHPRPEAKGFPIPNGTAFFISKDGHFVTARHVITKQEPSGKLVLQNAKELKLTKPEIVPQGLVDNISIVKDWPEFDMALLKADFDSNKNREAFKEKTGFDYIEVDFELHPEGTEVYSYGYPLPHFKLEMNANFMVGFHYFCPRTTSAIISSHYDVIGPIFSPRYPKNYVIDKALNYGNSGGPIIVQSTGKAIAVCTKFQPAAIPQVGGTKVEIPSLYGIASSLGNIENELTQLVKLCRHDFEIIEDKKRYSFFRCSKCGETKKIWKS
jgi:serine protease Do